MQTKKENDCLWGIHVDVEQGNVAYTFDLCVEH